ncbi:MAG TPA: SpoIIE family protein phosphatase [Chloroflexia bacterium]|nr:SpoIIE family protein phosphatase [Chloroflexia bacterium]
MAAVLVLFLAALVDTAGGIGRPWGGYTLSAAYVVTLNPAPGGADLGGPRVGDRVALMDGESPEGMRGIFARAMVAGRTVEYAILRPNATGTTLEPGTARGGLLPLSVTAWVQIYGSGLLLGLTWWALGSFIYLVGRTRLVHQIFLVISLIISSLILTDLTGTYTYQVTPLEPTLFGPAFGLLMPFAGAGLIRLAWYFPQPKPLILRHPSWQYWPYAVAAVIGVPNMLDTYRRLRPPLLTARAGFDGLSLTLDRAALFSTVLGALVLIGGIVYDRLRTDDPGVRRQVRIVGVGFGLGAAPLVLGVLLPVSLGLTPVVTSSQGYLCMMAAPLAMAYAIVRYRLFDVSRVVQAGAVYLLASSLLLGLYFLLVSGLQALLRELTGQGSEVVAVVSTLGIAVLLAPLITRGQRGVERLLFRERFLLRAGLRAFGAQVAALYDLDALADALVDETRRLLRVPGAALYLCRDRTGATRLLERVREGGLLLTDSARRFQVPESWVQATVSRPVAIDLDLPGLRGEADLWAPLHATGVAVVLPLVAGGELVGVLLLAPKRGQAGYLREELDVLEAIAGQAALALRNAELLRERGEQERLRGELEIARTIQRNLLPAEVPQLPGLDIAATCVAAQETSGDSYDLRTDDAGTLHVVVADACGTGIPAAMLIALSRNTLRGALARTAAPAQALTETNAVLTPDLVQGQFVAVLCASIDATPRQVRLANAGQMYPLLARPGCDGTAATCELLETPLPRLPLGVDASLVYQETCVPLQPGDLLVCYSDGLVDLPRGDGEPFGFDRLTELVRKAAEAGADAATTLQAILTAARDWNHLEVPQDGLTIIAVRVN